MEPTLIGRVSGLRTGPPLLGAAGAVWHWLARHWGIATGKGLSWRDAAELAHTEIAGDRAIVELNRRAERNRMITTPWVEGLRGDWWPAFS